MKDNLLRSILLTVAYCDQFEYPLSLEEIGGRLIRSSGVAGSCGCESSKDAEIQKFKEIEMSLPGLVKKRFLIEEDGRFALSGSSDFFEKRKAKEYLSVQKWFEVDEFMGFVSKIPWIQSVFVTGSLAMNNVVPDDDIDFLIITKRNSLWLSRAIVSLYALHKGKRRSWHGEEDNSWCLNMWLDEEHLKMPAAKRNLYSAYEVLQAKCVFDRGGVEERFARENRWIGEWGLDRVSKKRRYKETEFRIFDSLILCIFVALLDWFAYLLQLFYMLPHRTSERVGRGFAFFHPRDTKSLVMSGWKESLKRIKTYKINGFMAG